MKKIIFAGGCFWGVQAYFDIIEGVTKTEVGYANGNKNNPTYEEVCSHKTGFSEACYIEYDENITDINKLLESYFVIIDPTVKDRQGHDIGNQYRTGIYYYNKEDVNYINEYIVQEQKKYKEKIVTEVEIVKNFYSAETYHQNYLKKNVNGYCHIPRELLIKK